MRDQGTFDFEGGVWTVEASALEMGYVLPVQVAGIG
jgi:hypothetical protein